MRITLPADSASAIEEVGGLAALLDKNGFKAGAFIAVSVNPGEGHGGASGRSATWKGRLAPATFANRLNAKGWSRHVIERYFDAWEAAAEAGLVPHAAELVYDGKVEVPTEGWGEYYPPRWTGNEAAEKVAAQAREDGVGPTTAVTIARNPKAMASAIKANPKVAEAAATALREVRHAGMMDSLRPSPEIEEELERGHREHKKRMSTGSTEVGVLTTNMAMDRTSENFDFVISQLAGNEISDNLREMVETWLEGEIQVKIDFTRTLLRGFTSEGIGK